MVPMHETDENTENTELPRGLRICQCDSYQGVM